MGLLDSLLMRLGLETPNLSGAENFSDPFNINPRVPAGMDWSALGGPALPQSAGFGDIYGTSGGGRASLASWLPLLLGLVGTGYTAYAGQEQIGQNQDAYSQWQQQQRNLLAQAQGLAPQMTQDWRTLFKQWQANAALQRQAAQTAMNPALMGQRVAAAAQPLNQALVNAIAPQVNLQLAESGMSQAPGAAASAMTSALAPIEQQNLQAAIPLANDFGPTMSLRTASGAPPFMSTLQAMSGFNPSNVTLPPDILSMINQFRNSTYSLPAGVNF